mgnify:CR=1 FL=1
MALTDISHPTDIAMLTDLYELTMAQGLWESGKANEQGCFTAFYRDHPFGSAYAVMCGTAELPELVENLRFTPEDIDYLASLEAPAGGAMFKSAFLDYLRDFRAHVNIDAVPEGELVFPREPMVRVCGPALECQMLETALLNTVGFQTLVATKTTRVVQAAKGRPVAEFGLRRAQGPDGGMAVARASYVAGCSSTSNVLAGRKYGIPVFGTHAHSWVMSFDSELEAFRAFARTSPNNCTLLIDTYDVREFSLEEVCRPGEGTPERKVEEPKEDEEEFLQSESFLAGIPEKYRPLSAQRMENKLRVEPRRPEPRPAKGKPDAKAEDKPEKPERRRYPRPKGPKQSTEQYLQENASHEDNPPREEKPPRTDRPRGEGRRNRGERAGGEKQPPRANRPEKAPKPAAEKAPKPAQDKPETPPAEAPKTNEANQ